MTLFPEWRRRGRGEAEPLMVAPFDWMRTFFGGSELPAMVDDRRLPRADVAETDREYQVSIALPGFDVEDVAVRVVDTQLVVTGERRHEAKEDNQKKHFHRVETSYGAFERRFELPIDASHDPERVEATFRRGMLEIRIPKVEEKPVARIKVRSM
ncbi:MAG: Hsp20/alpha crystallin family protein [Planctomycetota bacterium]